MADTEESPFTEGALTATQATFLLSLSGKFAHVVIVSRCYLSIRTCPGATMASALIFLLLLLISPGLAQDNQAEESTNALSGFILQKGFKIELVASEPQVEAPVAMAFDENGRLFVAEMPAPPEGRATGRIRLLEDPEGDGTFTVSSVYAEDVPWPTSIACYDGGVFVAATPDILYLKDTRKKGIADVRRKVFSGFGGEGQRGIDPGHLVACLRWGPDGRIHGVTGGIGGRITSITARDPLDLGRHDFSFDPRSLEFRPEVGPGESAVAFDSRGRKFVTDSSRPLRTPAYELAAFARNPFAPPPLPFVDVMSAGAVIFTPIPIAEAPAKSPGTNAPGPSGENTNTTAPTSFSSARGTVFCGGSAFPTNYFDNVFIADPAARVIHRAALRDNGLFPTAERSRDSLRSEFLASKDKDFFPAAIVNGPDGALYVADRTQNPAHGRIYRIVPLNYKRPKVPQLSRVPTSDLVVFLANPNAWHRENAARLLYEGQDPRAVGPLTNMVLNSRMPAARLQALRTLVTLGAVNETVVLKLLKDPDARVREAATHAASWVFRGGVGSDTFRRQLQTLTADPSVNVRYQLAFTLGDGPRLGRASVLAEVLSRDAASPWFQTAVFSSLDMGAPELVKGVATTPRLRAIPAFQAMLPELAQMIGVRGQMDEVKQVLDFLYSTKLDPAVTYGLLYNLGEGLRRTRSSLAAVDQQNALQPFYDAAIVTATDAGMPAPARAEAARLLGISTYTYADIGDWLLLLMAPRESLQVQLGAASALSHMADPRSAVEILKRWQTLSAPVRREVITALVRRNDRAGAVLSAIQNRTLGAGDFSSTQLDLLRTYPDPALNQRALQLLGPVQFQRPQMMEKFKPAIRLPGVAAKGREVFVARCASCHWTSVSNSQGSVRRLSLAPVRTREKEKLLAAIIEPSAEVRPEEKTQIVETRDAEYFVGLLLNENPTAVTLLQADGTPIVVPRSNIQAIRQQPWSLMPSGLETGLSLQSMADLLEFTSRAE